MWLGVTNLRWLMETDLSAPGVMLVAQAVSTILAELGGRDATPGRRTTVKPYGDAV